MRDRTNLGMALGLVALLTCSACGESSSGASGRDGTGGRSSTGGATAGGSTAGGGSATTGGTGGGSTGTGGGGGSLFKVVDAAADAADCGEPNLTGTVRDFNAADPDFEELIDDGKDYNKAITGMVAPTLVDLNSAPVFVAKPDTAFVRDADSFAKWYSLDHPENATYSFGLADGLLNVIKDPANNTTIYQSNAFFPIDGEATQESGQTDVHGNEHNFLFTFELQTRFLYEGGEVFEFEGDDDLWVFIDGKLEVDLGGVHTPVKGSVALDTLGLTVGEEYRLSVFHAERHTEQSNFTITTSLNFTNCEQIKRVR